MNRQDLRQDPRSAILTRQFSGRDLLEAAALVVAENRITKIKKTDVKSALDRLVEILSDDRQGQH